MSNIAIIGATGVRVANGWKRRCVVAIAWSPLRATPKKSAHALGL